MNNEVNSETKTAVIKTLAIIGFIAVIVIGVWLSVQVVRIIPSAFSSLASIADSVYGNRPIDTLTIATEKNIVNSGESFQITWTEVSREGAYGFMYQCTNGVAVDVRSGGEVTALSCDEILPLPDGVFDIDIIATSEKQRFIDLPFAISFTQVGTDSALFEKNARITLVNASIPQSADILAENEEEGEMTEEEAESETLGGQSATALAPIVTEEVVSLIPTSDPNGFVDLKMTYLGVGTLEGNIFMPAGTIDADEKGALRFEVKNIGSKISDEWTFDVLLPTGSSYTSEEQAPLKPNERATITLGFEVSETGSKAIEGSVDSDEDTNSSNNSFEWSVSVE